MIESELIFKNIKDLYHLLGDLGTTVGIITFVVIVILFILIIKIISYNLFRGNSIL